jgi:glycosyltransferase involved in cell wall biosynthesis
VQPLVSVILPTRDRMQLLPRAVDSVLAQSERDFELIIINDASSDGTEGYLAELASRDSRVRVVRNPVPTGGAAARNAGIARSVGEWIAFIDDDDEWLPQKIERQIGAVRATAGAVACTCSYVIRFPSKGSRLVRVPASVALSQLFIGNVLGGASMCMCSARALKDIGGFDVTFKSAQDLDLWVRLRQRGAIVGCHEPLVLQWAHTGTRITTNMQSQYLGARHFYFKHRLLMDAALRRQRVAFSCFIMSRQSQRGLKRRLRHLCLCLRNASPALFLDYARSSGLRLLRDAVYAALQKRETNTP